MNNFTGPVRTFFRPHILAGLAVGCSGLTQADDAQNVFDRAAARNEVEGMPVGSFRLYPSVGLEYVYDDNIFRDDDDPKSDRLLKIDPRFLLRSDWGRHSLDVLAEASKVNYDDQSDEDHTNYRVRARARFDQGAGNHFYARLLSEREHEQRGDPDDVDGLEPTPINTKQAVLGYRYAPNRLSWQVEADFKEHDFDDVPSLMGSISNDDRDRDISVFEAKVGYEFLTDLSSFLLFAVEDVDYKQKIDDDGFERSFDGYSVALGTDFRFSGVTFGTVSVGSTRIDMDDSVLKSATETTASVSLEWLPTPLTSVSFRGDRRFRPTTTDGASAILDSHAEISVAHEITRRMIAELAVSKSEDEFVGLDRDDRYTGYRVSLSYQANRFLVADLGFSSRKRRSHGADGADDFENDIIWLGFRLQR